MKRSRLRNFVAICTGKQARKILSVEYLRRRRSTAIHLLRSPAQIFPKRHKRCNSNKKIKIIIITKVIVIIIMVTIVVIIIIIIIIIIVTTIMIVMIIIIIITNIVMINNNYDNKSSNSSSKNNKNPKNKTASQKQQPAPLYSYQSSLTLLILNTNIKQTHSIDPHVFRGFTTH